MKLRELLSYIDFDCGYFGFGKGLLIKLYDKQNANLGGIEDDAYKSVKDVIERCEIYWRDYIVTPICDSAGIKESDFKDWEEMYNYLLENSKDIAERSVLKYIIHPELVEVD